MKRGRIALAVAGCLVPIFVLIGMPGEGDAPAATAPAPVLSVTLVRARTSMLPMRVPATGNVVAWQEASIGAESDGLRLTEVRVNVGDTVRRGDVLAVFDPAVVAAELAEAAAMVAQVEAEAREAEANAGRAKQLEASGALSAQQIGQSIATARTARAKVDAARAVERRHRLRLAQTRLLSPDDGIVTARTATVGTVAPAGGELFRLIRDGRLEWRATIAMQDMDALSPGQRATLALPGRPPVQGTLRMLAPAIDAETRNGLAYIDLPPGSPLRAGTFARGHIDVGDGPALTVPQGAVLLRDGFHYVMRVGARSDVVMTKVRIGRRIGDRIEITSGLKANEDVIASGAGFLGDGDIVRVVGPPSGAPARTQAGGGR